MGQVHLLDPEREPPLAVHDPRGCDDGSDGGHGQPGGAAAGGVGEPVVHDIVGGTKRDPGDTELDDAIEIIVGDYISDSLLRIDLAQRIMAEVLRRTPIDDPYARRIR